MLIIAGYIEVDAADRDAYVEAFRDLVERARAAPGCLDLAITADSLDPRRVNNYERWESREHVDAWREVAAPPQTAPQIETAAVSMFDASGERDPFARP